MIGQRTAVVYLIGLVVCVGVAMLANTGKYFGKFLSKYFPCSDAPGTSFPCYGRYDIAVMALAVIVGIILVIKMFMILRKSG